MRRPRFHQDIPSKANWVLNFILLALILVGIRIWHLSTVQYDQKLEESRKPQRRTIVEPAKRASIRDRFNIPLALNKIQYQAAIIYSQIQQIPSVAWEKDSSGRRVKVFKRKEYISKLAKLLGEELGLDSNALEDSIYAKAVYYAKLPFVIKEEISEKQFYRLKMLEKDWLGIHVRKLPKRFYPQGKVAADVVGYMGAINRQEYETILHEIKALEDSLALYEKGEEVELPKGLDTISQVRKRLRILQQKAYTIHDYIGKTGVEGQFEQDLRGFQGKKSYYSDAKGNYLRELPGSRPPLPGSRFLLTLSSELQEYAESLLAQNETIRKVRVTKLGGEKRTTLSERPPWIKGGAIVVMDPNNGEILALASYPRFDPNDFIASGDLELNKSKQANICRWFENSTYLADLWDQKRPLERELWDRHTKTFYDEAKYLTWNAYIDAILPPDNEVRIALERMINIQDAIDLQNRVDELLKILGNSNIYAIFNTLYTSEEHISYSTSSQGMEKSSLETLLKEKQGEVNLLKNYLKPYLETVLNNYNKVLLIDLCRLVVSGERFSSTLLAKVGEHKVSFYHDASCALVSLKKVVEEMVKTLYHETTFREWRKENEKIFLKEKRDWEKSLKKYPTPYIDYLNKEEEIQFQAFWQKYEYYFLLAFLTGQEEKSVQNDIKPYIDLLFNWHKELIHGAHQAVEWRSKYELLQRMLKEMSLEDGAAYLKTMRGYRELTRPLLGKYRFLKTQNQQPSLEKHLAAAFYPAYGYGYGRSHAYRQATVQGSIFKIVTAYEALAQRFRRLGKKDPSPIDLNPMKMDDRVFKQGNTWYVGFNDEGKAIPQIYNGGRLPRSQMTHIGPIDILKALETSSNPYFSLLASEYLDDPYNLVEAAYQFSYGGKTGIDLPGELPGIVPKDIKENRTGLYAFAIGQHSMVVTPLQTAVMLSTLANGGKVLKPKIVNWMAGRLPYGDEEGIPYSSSFPYQDSLQAVGIAFPLFTASLKQEEKNSVSCIRTEVKKQVFMPTAVRSILLQAMRQMVYRTQSEGMHGLKKLYTNHPEAIVDYMSLKEEIIGKSSTSEVVERVDLDFAHGVNIYTHVWFGGIVFESPKAETLMFHKAFNKPELVVIVYLRYGGFGKEAAPIAAQIVKKWREIKKQHKQM